MGVIQTSNKADHTVRGYGTDAPTLHLQYAAGTPESPAAPTVDAFLAGLGIQPHNGSSFSTHSSAAFHFVANENHEAGKQGTRCDIWLTPNGQPVANRIKVASIKPDRIDFLVPVALPAITGFPASETQLTQFNGSLLGWDSTTRDERYFKVTDGMVDLVINIAGVADNSGKVEIELPVVPRQAIYRQEGAVGLIINNTTFAVGRYSINPGNSVMTIWPGAFGSWASTAVAKEIRLTARYEAEPEQEE